MSFFKLSLAQRLVLVTFSGILTYPSIRLDTALGPEAYPPFFSWWIILHGLLFGALVMAPFATANRRYLRAIALAIASVFIYDAAIRIPDLIDIGLIGDTGDFIVAGISGTCSVSHSKYATGIAVVRPGRFCPMHQAGSSGRHSSASLYSSAANEKKV